MKQPHAESVKNMVRTTGFAWIGWSENTMVWLVTMSTKYKIIIIINHQSCILINCMVYLYYAIDSWKTHENTIPVCTLAWQMKSHEIPRKSPLIQWNPMKKSHEKSPRNPLESTWNHHEMVFKKPWTTIRSPWNPIKIPLDSLQSVR